MAAATDWKGLFRAYGWACVRTMDGPLSIGVPHPKFGVMRATVITTGCFEFADVTSVAEILRDDQCRGHRLDIPLLCVGSRVFGDSIGDEPRAAVLGLLVYLSEAGSLACSRVGVVRWHDMWLPYFLYDDRVVTGWDFVGVPLGTFKPEGWDCRPVRAEEGASPASSVASSSGI